MMTTILYIDMVGIISSKIRQSARHYKFIQVSKYCSFQFFIFQSVRKRTCRIRDFSWFVSVYFCLIVKILIKCSSRSNQFLEPTSIVQWGYSFLLKKTTTVFDGVITHAWQACTAYNCTALTIALILFCYSLWLCCVLSCLRKSILEQFTFWCNACFVASFLTQRYNYCHYYPSFSITWFFFFVLSENYHQFWQKNST